MNKNKLSIKDWADRKFAEHLQDIKDFINKGIDKKEAYHTVMDSSTLGAGYKAQMKKEIGLTMFD